MNNLKASLIILSIVSIAEGVLLWFVPGRTADFLGISDLASGYLFASLGAALIAAGFIFALTGMNPLENVTGIKFAVLWTALALVSQIYAVIRDYVTWGHIWVPMVIYAIIFIALLIFYPYKRSTASSAQT